MSRHTSDNIPLPNLYLDMKTARPSAHRSLEITITIPYVEEPDVDMISSLSIVQEVCTCEFMKHGVAKNCAEILQSIGCIPSSPSPPPDPNLALERTEDMLKISKRREREERLENMRLRAGRAPDFRWSPI